MRPTLLALLVSTFLLPATASAQPAGQPRSYRLPSVNLKERIIWGAVCEGPNDSGLSFGGQDQDGETGISHTRIKVDGQWVDIRDDLWRDHPLTPGYRLLSEMAGDVRGEMVLLRAAYLGGKLTEEDGVEVTRARWRRTIAALAQATQAFHDRQPAGWSAGHKQTVAVVIAQLHELAAGRYPPHEPMAPVDLAPWPALIAELHRVQTALEQLAGLLAAEPPARALSPIVYDAKTKRYVLFGGDHLDHLTNDTWTFDPATRRWSPARPKSAPPARANHKLEATGDGKVILTGGYLYTSSTGYMSGQYRDHQDGTWVYDIAAETWTHEGPAPAAPATVAQPVAQRREGVSPLSRVYRTGALHPDFYLRGDAPDKAAISERLEKLPENTWVSIKPPHLPQLNRDWGSAVIDPDRNLILRFSGGHSAHGGTDVLHYHIETNRWELPFPVEFPLGQLYANTDYPRGYNFNRRPWVTGHTYQNYGYDPVTKQMLFTGQQGFTYIWNPDVADWTSRFLKPKGMNYGDSFYTLTLCNTPEGLYCWTQHGEIYQFDHDHRDWMKLEFTGEKLPGSSVDNSTMLFDSKRGRMMLFRKPYGDKIKYDGTIHAVDLATRKVSAVPVKNPGAAAGVPYLCQIRYDEANDLLLVGGTLPAAPGDDGLRLTPMFDCATNEWKSARITGDDPNGKSGRNVSLGLMYDARRKLFWAVDTKSNIFVLRVDRGKAGLRVLE